MTNVKHPAATAAARLIRSTLNLSGLRLTQKAEDDFAAIIVQEMLRSEAELDAAQAHLITEADLWLYGTELEPETNTELRQQYYAKDERE